MVIPGYFVFCITNNGNHMKIVPTLYFLVTGALLAAMPAMAQYPSTCATVTSRSNSNGMANSCPNANGTVPYATNFVGTSYATVPTGSKSGNLTITYSGANPLLDPYAITKVWITTTGTTLVATSFGPAGVPTVSGGNTQVSYCFYGANLPTAGTLSLQFTNPQTGVNNSICSFDAGCNSNCAVVANPSGVTLPVKFASFDALAQTDGSVNLQWTTAEEENNKGFSIERSMSDSAFSPIAFVPSSNPGGNSDNMTLYSYTDRPEEDGAVSYRLKQIDLDGNASYSNIVTVNLSGASTTPKVIAEGTQIKIQMPAANAPQSYDILVYDAQGRTLRHQQNLTAATTLITGLPEHSIYYVAIFQKNGQIRTLRPVYLD